MKRIKHRITDKTTNAFMISMRPALFVIVRLKARYGSIITSNA